MFKGGKMTDFRRFQGISKLFIFSAHAFLFALFGVSSAHAEGPRLGLAPLYAAKNSSEAVLTFEGKVEIAANRQPTERAALKVINDQLAYLFGPMAVNRYPAVPKQNEQVSSIEISRKENDTGVFIARYRYEGTIVVKQGSFTTYPVVLPIRPDLIYEAGRVGDSAPCSADSHYQTEGDFWYFWNPEEPGCPLRKDKDYWVLQGSIRRIPNTQETYPDYPRLKDDPGEITFHVLFGMDDPAKGRNPMTSGDINASNYRALKRDLEKLGFKGSRFDADQIARVAPRANPKDITVEELVKENPAGSMRVRLFFGPSGIDEDSSAFHFFLKDAIENASIVIYDGHSGLGGHLDLESIEDAEGFKIRPPRDRYQIYFFNSCTSYTYYNTTFFGLKAGAGDPKGTRQLDILTNGLATLFSVMQDTNLALIKAVDRWTSKNGATSYQRLAQEIDSDNLFGVNGDEDNPTSPPIAR